MLFGTHRQLSWSRKCIKDQLGLKISSAVLITFAILQVRRIGQVDDLRTQQEDDANIDPGTVHTSSEIYWRMDNVYTGEASALWKRPNTVVAAMPDVRKGGIICHVS